ncbi:hypothetical protein RchiOBHm_Chr2g0167211 [Rosa chinensis]|uniref:Uncharacterized protein n=1 Tax=Rosa chinensis TaxID=74649 RepID=A0A2P6S4A9_ROSCH|nr:hypothetical protein RchiOBHm_Chr2g0167211 [Rosa chinensis]
MSLSLASKRRARRWACVSDFGSNAMTSCWISDFRPPQKMGRSSLSFHSGVRHESFVKSEMKSSTDPVCCRWESRALRSAMLLDPKCSRNSGMKSSQVVVGFRCSNAFIHIEGPGPKWEAIAVTRSCGGTWSARR